MCRDISDLIAVRLIIQLSDDFARLNSVTFIIDEFRKSAADPKTQINFPYIHIAIQNEYFFFFRVVLWPRYFVTIR